MPAEWKLLDTSVLSYMELKFDVETLYHFLDQIDSIFPKATVSNGLSVADVMPKIIFFHNISKVQHSQRV